MHLLPFLFAALLPLLAQAAALPVHPSTFPSHSPPHARTLTPIPQHSEQHLGSPAAGAPFVPGVVEAWRSSWDRRDDAPQPPPQPQRLGTTATGFGGAPFWQAVFKNLW